MTKNQPFFADRVSYIILLCARYRNLSPCWLGKETQHEHGQKWISKTLFKYTASWSNNTVTVGTRNALGSLVMQRASQLLQQLA